MSEADGDTRASVRDGQELVSVGEATNRQGVAPVEDAEAEAVLLAPQLVWKELWSDGHGYRSDVKQVGVSPKGERYTVTQHNTYWSSGCDSKCMDTRAHYPTQDAAIAACERHHATGKWE